MPTRPLHDLAAFEQALTAAAPQLLFKHSPICPVSARALAEWEEFEASQPALQRLFVDVIADRTVARGLAAACGVAHQSPQAILFKDGKAVWHASHGAITAASLAAACRKHGAL